jgi:hypothetical protein
MVCLARPLGFLRDQIAFLSILTVAISHDPTKLVCEMLGDKEVRDDTRCLSLFRLLTPD